MAEIPNNHLVCKNPTNNGRSDQPQLVIAGFQPSTVGALNKLYYLRLVKLHPPPDHVPPEAEALFSKALLRENIVNQNQAFIRPANSRGGVGAVNHESPNAP